MIKTFLYNNFKLSKFKMFEVQFYTTKMYFNGLDLSLQLFTEKTIFQFLIDIFIFKLYLDISRRCDHPGTRLYISIFNVNFEFAMYDTRHWDVESNKYVENQW